MAVLYYRNSKGNLVPLSFGSGEVGATLYKSGTVPRSETDTPTEVTIPNDNWYVIALNCNGIPPFALYIARYTDETALVRLAAHSAAQDNRYAYATTDSGNVIKIHSTNASAVNYKVYKLPF